MSQLTTALRRELLEEAFVRAHAAHDASRRSSTASLQPESRQSAQQLAYDTGLTRLTLQARARESRSWETSRDRIRAEVGHLRTVVKSPHARRTAAAIERELNALDRRLAGP